MPTLAHYIWCSSVSRLLAIFPLFPASEHLAHTPMTLGSPVPVVIITRAIFKRERVVIMIRKVIVLPRYGRTIIISNADNDAVIAKVFFDGERFKVQ